VGAARRVAGRHDLRHDRRLQGGHAHHVPLGRVGAHRVRPYGLHRPQRDHPQRCHHGDPYADPQGGPGSRGRRRDAAASVHRRPGADPGTGPGGSGRGRGQHGRGRSRGLTRRRTPGWYRRRARGWSGRRTPGW
jgi:hypothetical protein